MKPSELACLSFLDALDGGAGELPDGCDIAQLVAEGLVQTDAGGRHELTSQGKARLSNLRTQERQYRRNL